MKLEEAIEITDVLRRVKYSSPPCKEFKALTLLIEAGKRYRSLQLDPEYIILKPLPGETEE